MSLREPKRPCREINQVIRNSNTLVNSQEKGYCSCPPFECICSYQPNISTQMQQYNSSPQSYQTTAPHLDSYWTQDTIHSQSYSTDALNLETSQYDFTNISSDLFQPEEIFQLDQPIKPDFMHIQNPGDSRVTNDIASRSPPTLLDLGSGTIHRELKSEEYWPQANTTFSNDDSNTSSNSRYNLNQSPDVPKILNNNCMNSLQANYYISPPKDIPEYISVQKPIPNTTFDQNSIIETAEFKSEINFDSKVLPYFSGSENNHSFSNIQGAAKSNRPSYPEYIDLAQYSDYSNFFNVYENKTNQSESCGTFGDLDFRIGSFSDNLIDYSSQNYDVVTNQ